MGKNTTQFHQRGDVDAILKEGVDKHINRINERVYPGFLARINRHLLDLQLQYIKPDLITKLTQVSSGHHDSQFHPHNMLKTIEGMRGIYISETAYYTAQGLIFSRLQEHESAYKALTFSLVAQIIGSYNPGNLVILYQEAHDGAKDLERQLNKAEKHAYQLIAEICLIAYLFFEKK